MNDRRLRGALGIFVLATVVGCGAPAPSAAEAQALMEATSVFASEKFVVQSVREDAPGVFSGEVKGPDGAVWALYAGARDGLLHFQVKRQITTTVDGRSTSVEDVKFGTTPLGR